MFTLPGFCSEDNIKTQYCTMKLIVTNGEDWRRWNAKGGKFCALLLCIGLSKNLAFSEGR